MFEECFSKESPNVSSSLFSIMGNLNPEFCNVYNFEIGDYVNEFNSFTFYYLTVFYFYKFIDFIASTILDSVKSCFDWKVSEFISLSFSSTFAFFFIDYALLLEFYSILILSISSSYLFVVKSIGFDIFSMFSLSLISWLSSVSDF